MSRIPALRIIPSPLSTFVFARGFYSGEFLLERFLHNGVEMFSEERVENGEGLLFCVAQEVIRRAIGNAAASFAPLEVLSVVPRVGQVDAARSRLDVELAPRAEPEPVHRVNLVILHIVDHLVRDRFAQQPVWATQSLDRDGCG